MKPSYCLLMLFSFIFSLSAKIKADTLVVGIDDYPPFTFTKQTPYKGIDIDIVNSIANALSLEVRYVACPFKRCLKMAETGLVDLVPGLYRTSEREEYLAFIEPSYSNDSEQVFYLNKQNNKSINDYAHLKPLVIGVKRGVSYFEKFDQDEGLTKFVVNNETQLVQLLKIGRIDTFISHPLIADYYISKEGLSGEFSKAQFRCELERVSHMALSKKSVFINRLNDFEKVVKQGVESGLFEHITQKFIENYAIESR